MKNYLQNLKSDVPAGLVVFLVAVPLCLGIALASGAPLFSGMISGIVGGIVIGLLSNSQLSVSGPAAGLAAIVFVQVKELGAYPIFLSAVVVAGVLQIILGAVKAGTIANYFPSNVIKGMLSAIGVLIILKQIPHAFGYDKDPEGDESFIQPDGENTFSEIWHLTEHIHWGSTLIALISIAILILWERPFMKKLKMIPPALIAVVLGVVMNLFFISSSSPLAIPQEDLVNVPISKSFNDFLGQFTFPDFSKIFDLKVLLAGGTIAVVASIETLLCIEAVDKIDPLKRTSNTNRELFAQGTGNIVSGLLGGLPVTSVIVRSSANVSAGGLTKVAAITHGLLILICVALIPNILNLIPLSALAAVLIMTGYKLAKPTIFKGVWDKGLAQFIPFIVTVVAVVLTDLLKGVGIGMVVSIFYILRGNMKSPYFFHRSSHKDSNLIKIDLSQEVSFLNKASIKLTLDNLPENSSIIIDASHTVYIDFDVLEIIQEFNDVIAPQKNIKVTLTGFKKEYKINNTAYVHDVEGFTKPNLGQPADAFMDNI